MKGRYRLMGELAEIQNLTELVSKSAEVVFYVRAVALSMGHANTTPQRQGLARLAHQAADHAHLVHRTLEAALKARDGHH